MKTEVEGGLPNSSGDRYKATVNQACYDYEAGNYLKFLEAENPPDHQYRTKVTTGLTRQVIDVLAGGVYDPAPRRKVEDVDARAEAILERFYEREQINALLAECESMVHLNDIVAIEVEPIPGSDDTNPAKLKVWTREELHVFVDPDEPRAAEAVVTIDRYDQQTRYRLWTDETVYTFVRAKSNGTSGGAVAELRTREENIYGELPFVFLPYSPQVRRFITPGIGDLLADTELQINQKLSLLSKDIEFPANILVMRNFPLNYNPMLMRGLPIRLQDQTLGGEDVSAYAPTFEHVSTLPPVAVIWEDVRNTIEQVVEACRAPLFVVRMDSQSYASGIALVAAQAPLRKRTQERRARLIHVENSLARKLFLCLGKQRGDESLIAASKTARLAVEWPEPRLEVPGPERDAADQYERDNGMKSIVDSTMERLGGCTREQAIEHLERVREENAKYAAIDPLAASEPRAKPPSENAVEKGS